MAYDQGAVQSVEFRRRPILTGETLPSFGQKLKLEREKRAITLDQISSSTKIGTRMLQALEEENFDHLPGGIFNKGFVRAYARFVGLDEEQTVSDYLEASEQNVASVPESAVEPVADPREASSDFPPSHSLGRTSRHPISDRCRPLPVEPLAS